MSRTRRRRWVDPEKFFMIALVAVGVWLIVISQVPKDAFLRMTLLPPGLFMMGAGCWGAGMLSALDSAARLKRDEAKEQRRIDRQFKKIQKQGRKQFKEIDG